MIISPQWYPNQAVKVDSDSKEFRDVLTWLEAHGAPAGEFEQGGEYGAVFGNLRGPDQILFRKSGFPDRREDALLTFLSPSLTLCELQSHFHFGDPRAFVPYAKPIPVPPKPVETTVRPLIACAIGPEIPGAHGCFYAVPGETAPVGTEQETQFGTLILSMSIAGKFWAKKYEG